MKFLVDECTGRHVFNWLKKNNYDVLFIKDEFCGAGDDWVLVRILKMTLERRHLIWLGG